MSEVINPNNLESTPIKKRGRKCWTEEDKQKALLTRQANKAKKQKELEEFEQFKKTKAEEEKIAEIIKAVKNKEAIVLNSATYNEIKGYLQTLQCTIRDIEELIK